MTPVASAQVVDIRVDIDNNPSNPDGLTWADAFKYLQDGLDEAEQLLDDPLNPPDTVRIWVAEGIYRPDQDAANPSGTGEQEATFRLMRHVEIYGGFDGTEEPLEFDLRDPATNITILSGDLDEDDEFSASYTGGGDLNTLTFTNYDEDNSYNVVTAGDYFAYVSIEENPFDDCHCADFHNCSPLICEEDFESLCTCPPPDMTPEFSVCDLCDLRIDETAVLDGFTIRSGNATGAVPGTSEPTIHRRGGGILVTNAGPRIRGCIIERNRATLDGQVALSGGGVSVEFSGGPIITTVARFDGCTIRHNAAPSSGGGVHVRSSAALTVVDADEFREIQRAAFIDCTISENKCGVFGAGVHADTNALVDLVNSSIVRNVIGEPRPEGVTDSDGAGEIVKCR